MTHKEAVDYFTNKYYELARKYRIYTKCRDNTQLMTMCVAMAIKCGVEGLECNTVEEISKKDWHYFLLVGDHIIEAVIILAKRNYVKGNDATKGIMRKNGGAYDSKK